MKVKMTIFFTYLSGKILNLISATGHERKQNSYPFIPCL